MAPPGTRTNVEALCSCVRIAWLCCIWTLWVLSPSNVCASLQLITRDHCRRVLRVSHAARRAYLFASQSRDVTGRKPPKRSDRKESTERRTANIRTVPHGLFGTPLTRSPGKPLDSRHLDDPDRCAFASESDSSLTEWTNSHTSWDT